MTIKRLWHALIWNEEGQDLAEYGIALAVIAAGVGLAAINIGENVLSLWEDAQTGMPTIP